MALPDKIRRHLTLPAFSAPMFLCSSPQLAAECRMAGIVGSLTMNDCRDDAEFETRLAFVSEAVARFADESPDAVTGPLAVNIAPTIAPERFAALLDMSERHGASIVVTSVGNPTAVSPVIKDRGLFHFHDITNIRFAEKAAQAGVDGMIAIGAGGGGHAGTISHLALIPKIRSGFDGVIVMAGAVSSGAVIRAAEVLGADLAYLGTRMIATKEASAPDAYKAMLVAGGVEDVIFTRGVNGLPASWLKASLREIGLDADNLFIPEGRSTEHLPEGKTPWRDIWSGGQGIGLIDDIPSVGELVARLREEYIAACATPDMAEVAGKA
ncbi:MAG: nitronate monooxygenase [Novosphingobium sp.]|nr:nitronate monooxygenase [Novosphingobium sp.]